MTTDGAALVSEPTIVNLIVAVNNLLNRCPAAFVARLNREQSIPPSSPGVEVEVRIQNMAPDMGTFQTPFWIGFHDGGFDSYDGGAPADLFFPDTNALERLAEDGSTGPISEAFLAQGFGAVDATLPGEQGPIAPGATVTQTFVLNPNSPQSRYFSYASMVIPSNDAFVANGSPTAHAIFDESGLFGAMGFSIGGAGVLDAGTEVNDELPENTAFFGQQTPNTGVDENGVVTGHPGFLPVGSGGILDAPMFAEADFLSLAGPLIQVQFAEGGNARRECRWRRVLHPE